MIRSVRGKYLYYEGGSVVIETASGIGFRIHVSDVSPILTAREGDEVCIATYMHVKEDGMSLYGFPDTDSLKLFEQLISVNGVGPKAGLAIMSLGTANQLRHAIAAKDAAFVSRATGVGKKTAERVILELSDKMDPILTEGGDLEVHDTLPAAAGERAEAVLALTTLGYTKKEAESAVGAVAEELPSAEEYIKKALRFLM